MPFAGLCRTRRESGTVHADAIQMRPEQVARVETTCPSLPTCLNRVQKPPTCS